MTEDARTPPLSAGKRETIRYVGATVEAAADEAKEIAERTGLRAETILTAMALILAAPDH